MIESSETVDPVVPPHVEDTVRTIERLHAQHAANATRMQRLIDQVTAVAGRPAFIVIFTTAVFIWIGLNLVLPGFGRRALDPPPFSALQTVITALAFYVSINILASQRRADQLASRREQLTLELAIIAERKTAKIIELIEEMRRDHPELKNRVDDQAAAMAAPSDAQAVLDAIAVATTPDEELAATATPRTS